MNAVTLAPYAGHPSLDKPAKPVILKREEAHHPETCPLCGAPARPRLLVAHIQATVAAYYGLHISAMQSARRDKETTHPRQLAMYLAKELTPRSLPDIGRRFGGRDHTTVMHAIAAVKKRIAIDDEEALDLAVLRERLAG